MSSRTPSSSVFSGVFRLWVSVVSPLVAENCRTARGTAETEPHRSALVWGALQNDITTQVQEPSCAWGERGFRGHACGACAPAVCDAGTSTPWRAFLPLATVAQHQQGAHAGQQCARSDAGSQGGNFDDGDDDNDETVPRTLFSSPAEPGGEAHLPKAATRARHSLSASSFYNAPPTEPISAPMISMATAEAFCTSCMTAPAATTCPARARCSSLCSIAGALS